MKNIQPPEFNTIAEFAEKFINQTNTSVFLTGKAGTGKTTLLKKIVAHTHKQFAIVAPTGIAALNAGGVTIHSFFQLPFSAFIPNFTTQNLISNTHKFESKSTLTKHFKLNKNRKKLIRQLELLIIDEVSMLRADLLDAIDWALRNIRKINQPFGGVQVLFIGDLLQLPPVVKPEEWSVLSKYYQGIHFFNAQVFNEKKPIYIELDKIYRQSDTQFIHLLDNLRNNLLTQEDKHILNKYVKPNINDSEKKGFITLTTHNAIADEMNSVELAKIQSKPHKYKAEISGDFPSNIFPTEYEIELKVGAQVMFIKNDPSFEKNFFNGKMGTIQTLSADEVTVNFPEENKSIAVDKFEWSNIRYFLNEKKGEIEEQILGTFVQYPLKLAWAITIHKSQGLTFDKAILDVSRVFAPGQAYVALSRLRSLNGLVLTRPIVENGLENDRSVIEYSKNNASENELIDKLNEGTKSYLSVELQKAFYWDELVKTWVLFEQVCRSAGVKTEKYQDKECVKNHLSQIEQGAYVGAKFLNQLEKLISKADPDWKFIYERIQAAYTYFFNILDQIIESILIRKVDLASKKKAKQYQEDLSLLEDDTLNTLFHLAKIKSIIEVKSSNTTFTKENLKTKELLDYKAKKLERIVKDRFNTLNSTLLIEEGYDTEHIELVVKKKKVKQDKKDTYTQTLEMFEAGKLVDEIAKERQLSLSTIEGHITRLIQQEKIELSAVMEQKRIQEIEDILESAQGKTLGAIKEELGDRVSYSELRWVQASKML